MEYSIHYLTDFCLFMLFLHPLTREGRILLRYLCLKPSAFEVFGSFKVMIIKVKNNTQKSLHVVLWVPRSLVSVSCSIYLFSLIVFILYIIFWNFMK
jgi:hypothetical protein